MTRARTWDYSRYAENQIAQLYGKACLETDRLISARDEAKRDALSPESIEQADEAVIRAKARERSWANACERLGLTIERRNSDRENREAAHLQG